MGNWTSIRNGQDETKLVNILLLSVLKVQYSVSHLFVLVYFMLKKYAIIPLLLYVNHKIIFLFDLSFGEMNVHEFAWIPASLNFYKG